jgi:hypothetical protein
MTRLIQTDAPFTPAVTRLLALLAGRMIPAVDGLPSASDPHIFADLLNQLANRAEAVMKGMEVLRKEAAETAQGEFASLDEDTQMRVIAAARRKAPVFLQTFEAAVVTAYYRDPRVQQSLGMPGRSPWPGGYTVQSPDWRLLDPVRARAPFWRQV